MKKESLRYNYKKYCKKKEKTIVIHYLFKKNDELQWFSFLRALLCVLKSLNAVCKES